MRKSLIYGGATVLVATVTVGGVLAANTAAVSTRSMAVGVGSSTPCFTADAVVDVTSTPEYDPATGEHVVKKATVTVTDGDGSTVLCGGFTAEIVVATAAGTDLAAGTATIPSDGNVNLEVALSSPVLAGDAAKLGVGFYEGTRTPGGGPDAPPAEPYRFWYEGPVTFRESVPLNDFMLYRHDNGIAVNAEYAITEGAIPAEMRFDTATGHFYREGSFVESGLTRVFPGKTHSCGVYADGTVACWGDNTYGQLGVDPAVTPSSSIPVEVPGLDLSAGGVNSIALGDRFTCLLTTATHNRQVACWGDNTRGQLGRGETAGSWGAPGVVPLPAGGATQLDAGGFSVCAITSGQVRCWGDNTHGQLGAGLNTASSNTPVAITVAPLSSTALGVSVGADHACGFSTGQVLRCWGANATSQLGDNSTTPSNIPVAPSGTFAASGIVEVAAGNGFTCARNTSGQMRCWGDNTRGQAASDFQGVLPTPQTVGNGYANITAGESHACATRSGRSMCWGDEYGDGQLVLTSPTELAGDAPGSAFLMAGGNSTAGVRTGQFAWMSGANAFGQLGNGTTTTTGGHTRIVKIGLPFPLTVRVTAVQPGTTTPIPGIAAQTLTFTYAP